MRQLARDLRRYRPAMLAVCAAAPALYALSRANYLLFHALIELVSVVVAFGTFTVAWNTRRTLDNGYLLFLGLAMPFVGALDLLHVLAFRGMGVFGAPGSNTATQLWMAARGLESVSLVAAPLLIARRVPVGGVAAGYGAATAALVAAVFTGVFPACYAEGVGLTRFKIAGEYAIILVLLAALRLLWRIRPRFQGDVFAALALALALTAAAEASFTLYRDVAGVFNMLGHLLKLSAFLLIYRALVVTGIVRPFDLLYRALKEREAELERENAVLASHRAELEAKNRELAALNDRKNELLGVAAHDIRSPLTVIEMYVTLLQERLGPRADPETDRFLEIIRRTSRKILVLVGDVLDYTSVASGTLRLERRPLALRSLVEESLASHAALARSRRIAVRLEPGDDPPPVSADPLRVEQVLANLVSNAVKFSDPGGAVTVRLVRRDGEAGFSVTDRGHGIPAEELPRIFAPFRTSRARGGGGESSTGLGLAIVRKIADAHGGRVEVASEPGRGSTFTFLLPAGSGGGEDGRGERI